MIAAVLSLIASLAPTFTAASQIAQVITTLEGIMSAVTAEVQAVLPMIKNIIAALQSNGAITADQMSALTALDAATDAAFESAAASAGAPPNPAG